MIDPLRHLKIFSPNAFGDKRVDVIGAGATGSTVTLELAKLGITNIHVWDFDVVEEHNIANQVYGLSDIGRPKVEALYDIVESQTGTGIVPHNEKVTGNTKGFRNFIFLLTDTMSSRKEISDGAIIYNPMVGHLIETRMGAELGLIYTINPNSPTEVKGWQKTLYKDEETEESACGASTTVGATAKLVSSLAVWQLIKLFNNQEAPNEITVSVTPYMLETRTF